MINRALKTLRQFHDMRQAVLADRLGISNSYLSEIERGKKDPSIELLKKYSDIFEVPLSSIVVFSETLEGTHEISQVRKILSRKALVIMEWIAAQNDENKESSATL